jgi:phage tail protein X
MAQQYRTSEGDTVDLIAWKYYGTQSGQVVEKLLAANAGLADRGPVLPAGLVITLPDMPTAGQSKGVKLWD